MGSLSYFSETPATLLIGSFAPITIYPLLEEQPIFTSILKLISAIDLTAWNLQLSLQSGKENTRLHSHFLNAPVATNNTRALRTSAPYFYTKHRYQRHHKPFR
jgi:hypothetical protein